MTTADGFLTKWSIHLTLFFFMYGMMLQQLVGQNMILQKLCMEEYDAITCSEMSSHPVVQDSIQAKSSKVITLQLICMGLPSAFSTLILGAASDHYGRKKIMLLTSLGVTMFSLSMVYQSSVDHISQAVVVFGSLACGVTGGIMSFIGTVTNYVTDITPEGERTTALSKVFPFMGLGAMTGTLSAGIFESMFGFQVVLIISFLSEFLALLLVTFCVEDVRLENKKGQSNIWKDLTSGAKVLLQSEPKGNRRRLLSLLFNDIVNMAFVMSEGGLMLLYTKRHPFYWNSSAFGLYAAGKQVAGVLGQVFGTGIIIKILGSQNVRTDFTILQLGVVVHIIIALITANSTSTIMLLTAIPFSILAGPAQSAGGSVTSRLVASDTKGSYTAFTSFLATFFAPVLSSLYNHLYSSSVTSGNPGFVFLFLAITQVAVFFVLDFGKRAVLTNEPGNEKHS
ncbi:Solute carrier family 46 member 3 [Holothuria leucospilota]|uniref:Solute carrier family 46 member 3 n=1 Tax=Holothuria leucospilota TaxID=206669 RepID=A0A9Q1HIB1_HOLLE|nr:Solute carrier family 46 member 3 [Holothuria leucospilota]